MLEGWKRKATRFGGSNGLQCWVEISQDRTVSETRTFRVLALGLPAVQKHFKTNAPVFLVKEDEAEIIRVLRNQEDEE
jgi:hypothetical protein